MHLDPAERAAAAILTTVRAGGRASGLTELEPSVLRRTLSILAEYDADVLVRIAAHAIEQQASERPANERRPEATVHRLIPRRRG